MDERLKQVYNKLLIKHHSAVSTDTELGLTDNWKVEKRAKKFWEDYHEVKREFEALLNKCVIS